MPILSVTSRIRKTLCLIGLLAWTCGQTAAADTPSYALTLGQARELAIEALRQDDPGLAVQVARGLLKADPKDEFAYYVIAAAEARRARPTMSRKAAALAYRYTEDPEVRYRSARLAARMAYAEDRLSLSQLWLRRSAIHAPDEVAALSVARDYKLLRRQNPWAFRARVDLRPSNNVNKGADTALQIIDGVPVTGVLSGSARALSGLIGSLDLGASYRFRADARSATSVGGRLYVQRVALSSEAKALAPNARNGDFAGTYAELSLRHAFAIGGASRGSGTVELSLGDNWSGGQRSFSFARLSGERAWALENGQHLRMTGYYERRAEARSPADDARVVGLGGRWKSPLSNGDTLTLSVALRDARAAHVNGTYRSASLRAGYVWDQEIGPAKINAGIVLGYSDYPAYISGGLVQVPGGRQDRSVYGDVGVLFHDISYAGFAPMLRLRAGRKLSNDSRYSMREYSVSLGFESKF